MIEGVVIKSLLTHNDERGFFREIFRFNNEFKDISISQISHSLVNEGVIKGWHGHKEQSQWNYLVTGKIKTVLYDNRILSSTYGDTMEIYLGDERSPLAYYFEPGILHAYKCLQGPMNIIYITSGCYDLSDEIRIDLSGSKINYKW